MLGALRLVGLSSFYLNMVLPGHIAGGYLATKALLFISHAQFSSKETLVLYVIGIIASEGPDFDLFKFSSDQKSGHTNKDNHRKYITHAPVVWLGLSAAIYSAGALIGSQFFSYIGLAVLVGSWSHFLADSIEYGIMWLWPFSYKFYTLRHVPEENISGQKGTLAYYWTYITKYYVKRWTCYVEILLIAVAILVAFK